MPYHLNDHIYVAQFRDELILLDTKKDQYTICSEQFSKALVNLLVEKPLEKFLFSVQASASQDKFTLKDLVDLKLIEEKDTPFPFYIDRKPVSEGVSNVDWTLPLNNKEVALNVQVFRAFLMLIKVNSYIQIRGFYAAIQLIKRARKKQVNYIIPKEEDLRKLASIVNKACLLYPTRTKCLEWAMTFVLLALAQHWKCNLEIGVQNYPFLAHAWVECGGKTIMDAQDLREGLAIILNEPFRKLRT